MPASPAASLTSKTRSCFDPTGAMGHLEQQAYLAPMPDYTSFSRILASAASDPDRSARS
ncbi:MAG: hypothetical protein ACPIOQ_21245 [Promethearchaeia archaeon]